jgi:hypothetical protein
MPAPADAWDALQAAGVAESFRHAVQTMVRDSRLLKAGVCASLEREGKSPDDVVVGLGAITGVRHTVRGLAGLAALRVERAQWKIRFANLMSGRFTEALFDRAFRADLERLGLALREVTAEGTFIDYVVSDGGSFEIALNLKNAGVMMREAARWFGLNPEDTIPIATYKIFGSEAGSPNLIYVYLIDWNLLIKLRSAYWNEILSEDERRVFRLLVSAKEIPEALEDAFITATVDERFDALRDAAGYSEIPRDQFRAISGARCRQTFLRQRDRSPYVFKQKMNTDPNVHISIEHETVAFPRFIDEWLATPEKRTALLEGLRRVAPMDVPDPPV